jgi:hypothetical protein
MDGSGMALFGREEYDGWGWDVSLDWDSYTDRRVITRNGYCGMDDVR